MSAEHLALWKSVEKTDPKFVKAITGKAYQGSSPSPHWVKMKLTEAFGPAGIGWGVKVLSEDVRQIGTDTMHYLRIQLWYVHEGKRGEIEAFGGTPLGGVRKSGQAYADEDAPKKSMTDAMVKAASDIGFCADIFLGRWDDSKYVAQRAEEQQAQNAGAAIVDKQGLASEVTAMVEQLNTCETTAGLAGLRAVAAGLRPKLKDADMGDAIGGLGTAISAAAKRLGVELVRVA